MHKTYLMVIFSLLLLSGCSATNSELADERVVNVVESCGSKEAVIHDVKSRYLSDGIMQVQVRGESKSEKYQRLEYRIIWFDAEGFVIKSQLSNWTPIPAYAKQPFYVNATAPSVKAETFRLYIRNEKEIICDQQQNGLR